MAVIKSADKVCAIRAVEDTLINRGSISAYILVEATGFNGLRVSRRVRIGYESRVSADKAKEMMQNLREANNSGKYDSAGPVGPVIVGRFVQEM